MNEQNQKLYVGNLNFDATEDQVRELFSGSGEVQEVKIVMDRFSGRSRGFAFVRMATPADANKAKETLNGQPFQGKALVIDLARTEQRDRPPMGERRERPAGEFRPRREGGGGGGGGGGWGGGGGGGDRGERREREPRGGGGFNRY